MKVNGHDVDSKAVRTILSKKYLRDRKVKYLKPLYAKLYAKQVVPMTVLDKYPVHRLEIDHEAKVFIAYIKL
jgi:hypothetical protein